MKSAGEKGKPSLQRRSTLGVLERKFDIEPPPAGAASAEARQKVDAVEQEQSPDATSVDAPSTDTADRSLSAPAAAPAAAVEPTAREVATKRFSSQEDSDRLMRKLKGEKVKPKALYQGRAPSPSPSPRSGGGTPRPEVHPAFQPGSSHSGSRSARSARSTIEIRGEWDGSPFRPRPPELKGLLVHTHENEKYRYRPRPLPLHHNHLLHAHHLFLPLPLHAPFISSLLPLPGPQRRPGRAMKACTMSAFACGQLLKAAS